MKVVILAGGLGTRLSEETELRPKPMVDIGERPILWHIMKSYATQGFKEFFVALGYKGEVIKRYFLDYHGMSTSVTIDVATGRASFHESEVDDWKVHLMDTGLKTSTGGRIKRLQQWLVDGTFMLTYGDGVSDVDMKDDDDSLEADVLTRLAKDRELVAYRHDRFWQSMDTLRDVRLLESLWQSGRAPWRNWE
jgi:glucose-1-phosphate cytidylyltransferase